MRRPPFRALWEITSACDLRCEHCLVEAGEPRDAPELDTDEALALVDELAELGVEVVSLTGGEPLLRRDWSRIARQVRRRGMTLRLSSNGHLLDDATLAELVDLGAEVFCVSLDGTKTVHDTLRRGPAGAGERSSFDRVVASLERLRQAPIASQVITTVTRQNLAQLPALHTLLCALEVDHWIVQLGHRTGRLTRSEVVEVLPAELAAAVADFIVRHGRHPELQPIAFNSVGYLSAQEPVLRASGRRSGHPIWRGCRCGVDTVGVEPDGGIKGCANQVGRPFVVGSVRQERLRDIWDDRERWFWLDPAPEQMSGLCAGCALAHICQGGCTVMAYRSTGELFHNPYCLRARARSR